MIYEESSSHFCQERHTNANELFNAYANYIEVYTGCGCCCSPNDTEFIILITAAPSFSIAQICEARRWYSRWCGGKVARSEKKVTLTLSRRFRKERRGYERVAEKNGKRAGKY